MAKCITSVWAVVFSGKQSFLTKSICARKCSSGVSVKTVLNGTRLLSGVKHRSSVSTVRYESSGPTEYIVESPLGPVNVPDMSLPAYIWKDFEEWSDKPAVTCGSSGRSYTFGEARFISHAFAIALLQRLQLKKGDVVGVLMPNIPEYVFAIYGAMEAGLAVTFVNPLYTTGEILRQFENAGVKCCITIPQLFPVSEAIGPKLKNYKGTIVVGGETDQRNRVFGFKDIVTSAKPNVLLPEVDPNEVALLPYSSGTTGMPKGVMLSHRNCVANLCQCNHPALVNHVPTSDSYQERILSVLPFFHIYGFNGILNTSLSYGMHMISIPKFTPESYIECVLKYKPTVLFVVPSLLLFLASHPAVKSEHLASIKEVTCGAAPATKSLMDKFLEKVARTDINIRQGYGMTETSPVTLFTPNNMPESKSGSTGQLVLGTRAKIVSLKTGENLPPHGSGELCVQGPQVMIGYLNNEQATKETIDEEGWLHTGDVAYYDEDGYFYIVDRTKELIKVKGNQVSPTELESIIMQMPGVADCAVVGIPDILSGEIPRAFVVLRPGHHLTESEVCSFLEPKVAPYKKLAGGVRFLDVIPRNPAGKVLRDELKVFGANIEEVASS
ncbi:4-coumarate--CoA ligase-like [Homalodisca vitripennis]|nr:4-coumarate--CoA ligase-like [Homalodisca vitripennis]